MTIVALLLGLAIVAGLQGFAVGRGFLGMSRGDALTRGASHAAGAVVALAILVALGRAIG